MKWLVIAALLSLARTEDTDKIGQCMVNGGRAVDDLLDAAVYIWAAVQRCNGGASGDKILCTLDISATIESVNAMVNVVMKAVQNCGALDASHHRCALAVGVLTRAGAGLTAGSAGIAAKCPNAWNKYKPLAPLVYGLPSLAYQGKNTALANAQALANADAKTPSSFAQCLVDVKDMTKSLLKAVSRVMTLEDSCNDGRDHCAHNYLKLVASLGAMGQYLAGAVGRCAPQDVAHQKANIHAECTAEVLHSVRHLTNVGRAAVDMNKYCRLSDERLYQIANDTGKEEMGSTHSNLVTLALTAMLPITAVLSFVGGSRFAKVRTHAVLDIDEGME